MISNLDFFGYACYVWPKFKPLFSHWYSTSKLFQSGQEAYVLFMKDKYGFGTISITKIPNASRLFMAFG